VPTLFVPNAQVADDQAARAHLVAQAVPAVVSPCETPEQRANAVAGLLAIRTNVITGAPEIDLRGAEHAADEILALINNG
jgi:UDP-N-acetylglucosamine:LPS N-acetylglucosamine transferase